MAHLRAHLELERHPITTLGGAPPFHWSLPPTGQPLTPLTLHLRQLVVEYQVLPFDRTTLRPPAGGTGPARRDRVSTGEPLSVFPYHVWHDSDVDSPTAPTGFECRIIWLEPRHVYGPQNPDATFPGPDGSNNWYFRDRYPFELGVIWVQVFDSREAGHQLTPRPIIARFLHGPSPDIPEPLIGLNWSIFRNRRFVRETDGHEIEGGQSPPARLEEWLLFD